MAKRYGHSQHVAGWQLDNEFGCHDTVHNFDKHARSNFDKWLEHKYDSNITKLNEAWGNGTLCISNLPILYAILTVPLHSIRSRSLLVPKVPKLQANRRAQSDSHRK